MVLVPAAAAAASGLAATDQPSPRTELIERTTCSHGAGSAVAPVEAPVAAASGLSQTVSVGLPATVIVEVDASGAVVAATTNTGCAPRPGDDVYVRRAGGELVRGSQALLERSWVGDFREAGVFQAQA
jgi:hypothetical protein